MNIENIDKAIAIMKRVPDDRLYMDTWQGGLYWCKTEEEMHPCGNTACFAGWVALSPEFQADGGRVDISGGYPIIWGLDGVSAISYWLDIPYNLAFLFIHGDDDDFYPVPFEDVKPHHVIENLEKLKKGEYCATDVVIWNF